MVRRVIKKGTEYCCMRILVFLLLLVMVPGAAAQSSLHVDVVVNQTANDVYVPGDGVIPSAGIPDVTYVPSPFFIASYSSGFVAGLASMSGDYVRTDGGTGNHTIGIVQPLANSRVLLAFTEGDWQTIGNRMDLIENGEFFRRITPSFAFGLGTEYVIRMILHYPGIDIEGGLEFSKGIYRLIIENKGMSGGKPLVEIGGT
jgi:hypothetical protein